MKGLIKKDLFTIKGNLKTILVIFFVFILMSLNGESNLSFILPLICIMMFMSTFSYDEFNNWNTYAITLPNGRKNIVKSKYLATIILVLIATIVTSIIMIITKLPLNKTDIDNILYTMVGSSFSVLLIEAISYPLIFKYGIEKGRVGLFAGVFLITAIFGIILKNVDLTKSSHLLDILDNYFVLIIPIITILMLLVSFIISKKIYLKKEF